MSRKAIALLVAGFAIGALSDFFLITNGWSHSGETPLDKYPLLWPIWLAVLFLAAAGLEGLPARQAPSARFPAAALAIALGALVMHAVLFMRDVAADPTSHNLWPFEFLFWGIVVAVPVLLGWLLARVVVGTRGAAPLR